MNAGEMSSFGDDFKLKQNTEKRPLSVRLEGTFIETDGMHIKLSERMFSLSPLAPKFRDDWSSLIPAKTNPHP